MARPSQRSTVRCKSWRLRFQTLSVAQTLRIKFRLRSIGARTFLGWTTASIRSTAYLGATFMTRTISNFLLVSLAPAAVMYRVVPRIEGVLGQAISYLTRGSSALRWSMKLTSTFRSMDSGFRSTVIYGNERLRDLYLRRSLEAPAAAAFATAFP